jgi:hypothetical protein
MRDVRAVTTEDFIRIGSKVGHLRLIVHIGGSPCPGLCRWNPFREGKQADASRDLLAHMRRLTLCLRESFPDTQVEEVEENVASMSSVDRDEVTSFMGSQPLCFDSSDLRPQRRRRYFWATWSVNSRPGVVVEEREGYTHIVLEPASKPDVGHYLATGWTAHPGFTGVYPTLTRPCAVATPRFRTPGDNTADEATLVAWREDQHRRPPIHYEERFKVVRVRDGAERRRSTEELEYLSGFDTEYTLPIWKMSKRRTDRAGFCDARESVLGNAYDPDIIAFLLAELAWQRGLLAAPLCVEQLAWRTIRLEPAAGVSLLADTEAIAVPAAEPLDILRLVKWLVAQQSARGGEIRNLKAAPHAKGRWQEVDARWFHWETVLSVPWRWRENINVAEARARDLAIRLRARQRSCQRQRYVHLMDSQVNLACIAKGRTGSRRVGHVMRRASATLLATGLHEVVAYVRSDRNPADRASRDRHRWARHRRNLVIKKAVSTRSREGRVRSTRPGT